MKSFEISTILSKEQYDEYLVKLDELMGKDPSPDSPEGKLLETLVAVIEAYEKTLGWEI